MVNPNKDHPLGYSEEKVHVSQYSLTKVLCNMLLLSSQPQNSRLEKSKLGSVGRSICALSNSTSLCLVIMQRYIMILIKFVFWNFIINSSCSAL